MKIKIADLDLSLQTRAGTDVDTINNYAEAMADGASFVCKVENTRWPVSAASMAMSAVSESRISPIITMLGA